MDRRRLPPRQKGLTGSESTLPALPASGPSPDEQTKYWNKHPIHRWTDDFILPTPPLLLTVDYCVDRIDHGAGGIAFVGTPQFGKSTVIRYLRRHLQQAFPGLATFEIEFPPMKGNSQLDFLGICLGGIDAHLPLRWPTDERRQQLVTELVLRAATHELQWVVLFLDEVQNLTTVELKWLKFIVSSVSKLGVRVLVFSFAQPELLQMLETLKAKHEEPILKRFFLQTFSFHGIRSAADLHKIFELLDWAMRFPDPLSGWSFTQFYFPQGFVAGWRLADDAAAAFTAIKGDAARVEFGMDGLRDLVQAFVRSNAKHDSASWKGGTAKQWENAVKAAPALHL